MRRRIIFEIDAKEIHTANAILEYLWEAFERLDLHEDLNGRAFVEGEEEKTQ